LYELGITLRNFEIDVSGLHQGVATNKFRGMALFKEQEHVSFSPMGWLLNIF
jgi:hypothetical protein